MKYIYCPMCSFRLDTNRGEYERCNVGAQYCAVCEYVNWNNPIPVASVLVPFKAEWESKTAPTTSILVVKRKLPPFPGRWCLPCGYMNSGERPKASARREVLEETNVLTRMVRLIAFCNPSPEKMELNQLTACYLAKVVEDEPKPKAGDDASAVGIYWPLSKKVKNITIGCFEASEEELCFSSHQIIVNDWLKGDIDRLGVNYELKYTKK